MPEIRELLFGRNPRRTTVRILVLLAVTWILLGWVLIPIKTDGISMEPTYSSGSFNFVNRLAYRFSTPSRGDIVAIRLTGPHVLFVKRIIALPGERIAIQSGEVFINGAPLLEPYVHYRKPWELPEVAVGADEYFVIGDNRGMNAADHKFGRIDAARIVGRIVY